MKPESTGPNTVQMNIEQRMRTVRILWLVLLVNVGLLYLLTNFADRAENLEPNSTLSLALLAVGVSTTLISFLIKNKLINQAIEQRQVQQVQQGYIVAWAMCEVSALLGLMDFFLTNDAYFYVFFIIAALGEFTPLPAPRTLRKRIVQSVDELVECRDKSNTTNSSTVSPVCLMIARNVPRSNSL
ncbi:MAG TPA: hypothetical protein VJP89_19600 [Pyrinomonadaceae bacterium]|nr:hypothetical protein [Pyrinomonadaceae bacterium]